jgi:hypothetical protein
VKPGPTLPLRTCSTCFHWCVSQYSTVDKGDHALKAHCVVHNVRKSGSDKCSKWKKPITGESEW